jgi:class 3 adenylate cyclase
MAQLRSTVIVKTDLSGFMAKVASLSGTELSALLAGHRDLIREIAARHEGSIIKGEGDSFWLTFDSVTAASLAAIECQQELRANQPGQTDERRLAMRAVISLGDVLHQESDIFGDAVNLAARIETVTPRDEIYMSEAAWLAMSKAEVRTGFVGEFRLKGLDGPVKVYRIEQQHRTRIIKDQVIVFTDLRGFSSFTASRALGDVEALLLSLDSYHKEVCEKYGGVVRMIVADSYHLTFADPRSALSAVEELRERWASYCKLVNSRCSLGIGIHKGDSFLFRSFLYGVDINVTTMLQGLSRKVAPNTTCVLLSGKMKRALAGTDWEGRIRPVEISPETRYETDEAYELI